MLLFATAAHPANIPRLAPDGQEWYGAAPYFTGYPWPRRQLMRFEHRFFIVQTPIEPWRYAKYARCIDVETLAVEPAEVQRFCKVRNTLHNDATVYCSESTMPEIVADDPTLDFNLYAALWDHDPTNRPTWNGKEAWAKQYEPFPGYESSILYEHSF